MKLICTFCVFLVLLFVHGTQPPYNQVTEDEYRKLIYVMSAVYYGPISYYPSYITYSIRPIQEVPAYAELNGSWFYHEMYHNDRLGHMNIMRVAFENNTAHVYNYMLTVFKSLKRNANLTGILPPSDIEGFNNFFLSLQANDLFSLDENCQEAIVVSDEAGNVFSIQNGFCGKPFTITLSCSFCAGLGNRLQFNISVLERYPVPESWNAIPC